MNKNADLLQIFLGMSGKDSAPNLNFSKLLQLSELHVNIDKANNR